MLHLPMLLIKLYHATVSVYTASMRPDQSFRRQVKNLTPGLPKNLFTFAISLYISTFNAVPDEVCRAGICTGPMPSATGLIAVFITYRHII
jgi:hypothetical protein